MKVGDTISFKTTEGTTVTASIQVVTPPPPPATYKVGQRFTLGRDVNQPRLLIAKGLDAFIVDLNTGFIQQGPVKFQDYNKIPSNLPMFNGYNPVEK